MVSNVIVNLFLQSHLKELLLEHAPPLPAIADYAIGNLIRMGFPQRGVEGLISTRSCGEELKVGIGYACPRCYARVCELPTECRVCGLTLVSSPHLARSYHHLFPIPTFNEESSASASPPTSNLYQEPVRMCFACQQDLSNQGKVFYLFFYIFVHES